MPSVQINGQKYLPLLTDTVIKFKYNAVAKTDIFEGRKLDFFLPYRLQEFPDILSCLGKTKQCHLGQVLVQSRFSLGNTEKKIWLPLKWETEQFLSQA